jgi:branched-chain amino acid aminotransferase
MKQRSEQSWMNGEFVPWDDAKVHVLTHTLHYGSGVFEGIRAYETATGPAIFRLPEHIDRLIYSGKALNMTLRWSRDELIEAVVETVRKSGHPSCYIRPLAFYGYGKMGVNPIGNPVELIIACWPWGAYLPHDMVDLKVSSFIRIHPQSTVADAKIVGHYVNSIMSILELQGTHYHESLLLDTDGAIAEGPGENFFMVKGGEILTPSLGTILPGITRRTIIEIASDLGIPVREQKILLADALSAEEAFYTGTAAEVTPIRSIDDAILGTGKIGPITEKIKSTYLSAVRGELPQYEHYLTRIN